MIKFITDSASDIPEEYEKDLDIKIMPIPITIGEKGYYERLDFTSDEFYKILSDSEQIPVTSHINMLQFGEEYSKAFEAGYDEIIHVTISSTGSAMFEAAQTAREMFYKKDESRREKIKIHVIDSKTYSYGYGFAVVKGAEMAREGKTAEEILAFMNDYFRRVEVWFSVCSLKFAKKSGRIGVAASFAGEMLGLRPIISIIDGKMKIVDKVRGDKNIPLKLAQVMNENIDENMKDYSILVGAVNNMGDELEEICENFKDKKLTGQFKIGASVVINSGPEVLGIAFLSKNRR